jgi:hypothetical protein
MRAYFDDQNADGAVEVWEAMCSELGAREQEKIRRASPAAGAS